MQQSQHFRAFVRRYFGEMLAVAILIFVAWDLIHGLGN